MKIKKYLKRTFSYLIIIGLAAVIIIFIIFLSTLESKAINNKVNEILLNSKEIVESYVFDDHKEIQKTEHETYDYKKLSKYNINNIINDLQKQNKISEAYLFKAYKNILYDEDDKAEDNLKNSLNYMKKSTNTMSKIYAATLLSKIYISDNHKFKAYEVVRDTLLNIGRKDCNNYYEEIWMLMDTISNTNEGRRKVILFGEDILEQYNDLSNEAKLYFEMKIKDLHMQNHDYAKASEYTVRGCYTAYDLKDNYSLAECIIDIGIILKEIENRERAIEFINKAVEIPIENHDHRVQRDVYSNINLAEIYLEIGRYEEAEICLNKIAPYKELIQSNQHTEMEIRRLIILSAISFYKNDVDKGKEYLDYADKLIESADYSINSGIQLNYHMAYGNYLEALMKYNEAVDLYNGMLKWCVENNDIYNQRRLINRLTNIAINNVDYKLEEEYFRGLFDLINNNEDMIYSNFYHYIAESVNSDIVIQKQKSKYIFIFKVLFVSITLSIIIFLLFYRKIKKLRIENNKDGLTKSYNRIYFNKIYEEFIRKKEHFTIIMIDVDNFKKLNDTYGHQFGDTVLIKVCNEILGIIDNDMKLCRYGGEEFVIISPERPKDEIRETADLIRKSIMDIKWDEDVVVTLSLGIAEYIEDKEETLRKADQNLYYAKRSGKNKVVG